MNVLDISRALHGTHIIDEMLRENGDDPNDPYDEPQHADGGCILWSSILKELRDDASSFKVRVTLLDCFVKRSSGSRRELEEFRRDYQVPMHVQSFFQENVHWNGCKFINALIGHLTTAPDDVDAKRRAITHTARSLGGCECPSDAKLRVMKRVDVLEVAYREALLQLETGGKCTALFLNFNDIEVHKNPGTFTLRPGTFTHMLAMTISSAGVHLYQGYGARGYTLKQYMLKNEGRFPLSTEEAGAFVSDLTQLLRLSADNQGHWTAEVNKLYAQLFEVDLAQLGMMRVGSQFDPFLSIEAVTLFDAQVVRDNFNFNIRPHSKFSWEGGGRTVAPTCFDDDIASGARQGSNAPGNGGVKRYYAPAFADYAAQDMHPVPMQSGYAMSRKVKPAAAAPTAADELRSRIAEQELLGMLEAEEKAAKKKASKKKSNKKKG